jgi:uncharacterized protein YcbX
LSEAGALARLWRYPVKSLLGEACAAAHFDVRGMEFDRGYAIRGADGKIGSGKNTRRMRQMDGLFRLRAGLANGRPAVTFEDGTRLACDDPGIHAALSRSLGEPVTLVKESEAPHFDAAPVHLVTTGSLAWLRGQLPGVAADERRFRPNLVIDAGGAGPVEAGWVGRTLRIGAQLQLRVIDTTERCRMVTLAQDDLPEDLRVLRAVAQGLDTQFGVYAAVVTPGEARVGDPLRVA